MLESMTVYQSDKLELTHLVKHSIAAKYSNSEICCILNDRMAKYDKI